MVAPSPDWFTGVSELVPFRSSFASLLTYRRSIPIWTAVQATFVIWIFKAFLSDEGKGCISTVREGRKFSNLSVYQEIGNMWIYEPSPNVLAAEMGPYVICRYAHNNQCN